MKKFMSLLAAVLLSSVSFGQTVKMPTDIQANTGRLAKVEIVYDGNDPHVLVLGKEVDSFREQTDKPQTISLRILSYVDQEVTVLAWCVKGDKSSEPGVCKVTIGTPVPPTPKPDPKPEPIPVPPTPIPSTPIIGVDGNAVLLVTEVKDGNMVGTAEQKNVLYSADLTSYLDSHCATDPARNDWKAWRRIRDTTDVSGDAKAWQDALKRPRQGSSPWIVISTKKGNFEGSLPKTKDEIYTLLKKYLGD